MAKNGSFAPESFQDWFCLGFGILQPPIIGYIYDVRGMGCSFMFEINLHFLCKPISGKDSRVFSLLNLQKNPSWLALIFGSNIKNYQQQCLSSLALKLIFPLFEKFSLNKINCKINKSP
jgi:hypothetical protein